MSESKHPTKLQYLEAQRRWWEKNETDPDYKIILLYELDREIKREKEKAKPK